jgi:uncharacterized protein YegJ (DUF2314 family)
MYTPGDYVKAEIKDEALGESEWLWVRVEEVDDGRRLVFGVLDNEPIVVTELHLGMKIAVSYDNIREHMKAESFNQ